MRQLRQGMFGFGVALVAAYMLVLQVMVGAFAMGVSANAGPMLDAFGNPLCITSHAAPNAAPDVSGGQTDHENFPECCTVSCSMFAPLTIDPQAPHALDNPLVFSSHHGFAPSAVVYTAAPDHDPGSPRAPPLVG